MTQHEVSSRAMAARSPLLGLLQVMTAKKDRLEALDCGASTKEGFLELLRRKFGNVPPKRGTSGLWRACRSSIG